MNIRFGELLDLIAVEQIKCEGARRKPTEQEEQDEFLAQLMRR